MVAVRRHVFVVWFVVRRVAFRPVTVCLSVYECNRNSRYIDYHIQAGHEPMLLSSRELVSIALPRAVV